LTLSISEKDAVVNERAGKDSTMFINNIESMECPEQRVSTFARINCSDPLWRNSAYTGTFSAACLARLILLTLLARLNSLREKEPTWLHVKIRPIARSEIKGLASPCSTRKSSKLLHWFFFPQAVKPYPCYKASWSSFSAACEAARQ
jgi:hypothetical protein